MKKLLTILLLSITLSSYSQYLQLNAHNIQFQKEERLISVDNISYTILIQEKLYKNTWRMFLIKENQYYDCLYTKKKFILIKPL